MCKSFTYCDFWEVGVGHTAKAQGLSWLCLQVFLLAMLRGLYAMPEKELGLSVCKASALTLCTVSPALLNLLPGTWFFYVIINKIELKKDSTKDNET